MECFQNKQTIGNVKYTCRLNVFSLLSIRFNSNKTDFSTGIRTLYQQLLYDLSILDSVRTS